jgi:hypothetical protein
LKPAQSVWRAGGRGQSVFGAGDGVFAPPSDFVLDAPASEEEEEEEEEEEPDSLFFVSPDALSLFVELSDSAFSRARFFVP